MGLLPGCELDPLKVILCPTTPRFGPAMIAVGDCGVGEVTGITVTAGTVGKDVGGTSVGVAVGGATVGNGVAVAAAGCTGVEAMVGNGVSVGTGVGGGLLAK